VTEIIAAFGRRERGEALSDDGRPHFVDGPPAGGAQQGIVKLRKIRSTVLQDIGLGSDQGHDIMGTHLGCVPAT
jgi:hypothetical protein